MTTIFFNDPISLFIFSHQSLYLFLSFSLSRCLSLSVSLTVYFLILSFKEQQQELLGESLCENKKLSKDKKKKNKQTKVQKEEWKKE